VDWRQAALEEIDRLKLRWIDRYRWAPSVAQSDETVDLFVSIGGRKTGSSRYVLRLRYQQDWQVAGRREDFVDPGDFSRGGRQFWPTESIRGVNPQHNPVPAICLRGVYGFHSVLHTNERPEGTTLQSFLLQLQQVFDT
jgi:hypothetical protein